MRSAVVPRTAIATSGAHRHGLRSGRKTRPAQNGIRTSPRSFASNAKCSPESCRVAGGTGPPRPRSTSRTQRSPRRTQPMPFAATGRSKPHPTTAATSHSARTNHGSVQTPACLLASAASPSTSSSQTRPAPSARTATAPLSRASITCLKSWRFHSVEQPCRIRRSRPGAEIRFPAEPAGRGQFCPRGGGIAEPVSIGGTIRSDRNGQPADRAHVWT
jgi:hypothetical protein